MKKCPDCAEQVQDEARVCRYCGYRFPKSSLVSLPPPQAPVGDAAHPGWYPNPESGGERYWNGEEWTLRLRSPSIGEIEGGPDPVTNAGKLTENKVIMARHGLLVKGNDQAYLEVAYGLLYSQGALDHLDLPFEELDFTYIDGVWNTLERELAPAQVNPAKTTDVFRCPQCGAFPSSQVQCSCGYPFVVGGEPTPQADAGLGNTFMQGFSPRALSRTARA